MKGREMAGAVSRRRYYAAFLKGVTQASLPRGVLEIILNALVVSARRFC